jgi:probable rRNA maturation factor
MPIHFFEEDITFSVTKPRKVKQWIKKIVEQQNKKISNLNYIFCSDEFLYKMNVEYLQHDTYTDIITFDYSQENSIEGEMYISIERIEENAKNLSIPFEQELLRVIIHGVWHLLGYKDKTNEEEKIMRTKEQESLQVFYEK